MDVRSGMRGRKGVAQVVQPSISSSLEPLEPRLLLSADSFGMEAPAPLEASLGACAVEVDLDRQDEPFAQSDPALIFSYLAPVQDQDDVAAPSGTDTLPSTQNQPAATVEAPVASEGGTLQFQDDSSSLIAVNQQDVTAGAKFLPIEARGPPVQGAVGANASSSQTLELFGVSPALFVENQGQWADSSVRYVHDGASMDVAVTDSAVRFQASMSEAVEGEDPADPAASTHDPLQANDTNIKILQFSASFVGARTLQPVGLEPSGSLFNYYLGDQANWCQNVPSYEIVASEGLYEGIDLHIQGLAT